MSEHPRYRDVHGRVWEDRDGGPFLIIGRDSEPTDWISMQGIRHAYGPLTRIEPADDPGAAPCPHGVELDMCDTRECAHTLNQITKEA